MTQNKNIARFYLLWTPGHFIDMNLSMCPIYTLYSVIDVDRFRYSFLENAIEMPNQCVEGVKIEEYEFLNLRKPFAIECNFN